MTLFVAVMLLALAPAPVFGEAMSHSGTIAAVDPNAWTIDLEEIGPWRVRDGETVLTRYRIAVTPFTNFVRARRVAESGRRGYPGDFVEEFVEPWTLRVGDFVTVLCQHDGTFLTALEIVVSQPDGR